MMSEIKHIKRDELADRIGRKMYEQFNDLDDTYAWFEYKKILSDKNVTNEYLQISYQIIDAIVEALNNE